VKRKLTLLLLFAIVCEMAAWAGIGSHDALFVGGTINSVKEKTEGRTTNGPDAFVFEAKSGKISIPYTQINGLEYGQKAGRRVGMAVAISPLLLFSKKRRHYLTVSFMDENKKQQAAVFELGKDIIKPTLTVLETKTTAKVEYQDDEARKSAEGK
jgi:hypothetical protein